MGTKRSLKSYEHNHNQLPHPNKERACRKSSLRFAVLAPEVSQGPTEGNASFTKLIGECSSN